MVMLYFVRRAARVRCDFEEVGAGGFRFFKGVIILPGVARLIKWGLCGD